MGEIAPWVYTEYNEAPPDMDQLGQKLLCTTLELEKLKSETMEEMQKNKDYVNQLILVLRCAIQERDEARSQLEKFINRTDSSSNSLSETYNYGSPPVDSDEGSLIIESLVKGRVLPQKGTFLKAVIEAGPLLQTLLVAGPLPRWRNPPQLQPFQIPPVSIHKPAPSISFFSSAVVGNNNNNNNNNNDCFGLGKRPRFC
ncbi:hypothetical protein ACS0TY_015012 [Phlomoides rotata]